MSEIRVEAIHIHPVKSCRRIEVDEASVLSTGLAHDREWQIVDADGSGDIDIDEAFTAFSVSRQDPCRAREVGHKQCDDGFWISLQESFTTSYTKSPSLNLNLCAAEPFLFPDETLPFPSPFASPPTSRN